jgi:hypothetical protein
MSFDRRRAGYTIAIALLATPLLAHAYLGFFTRYMADDYCTAASARDGLLAMQKHFYLGWSGRFAFTFTIGLVESLGVWVVPFLPGVLVAAFVAALAWAVSQFGCKWPAALLLAELIAFATFDDNKGGVFEAVYWQTGALTYLLPLVLMTILAGYLARLYFREGGRAGVWRLALCGLLAFYAGGFSETYLMTQTAALAVALAACGTLLRRERRARVIAPFCAVMLGSLLALAVVAAAPGNQVRQAALPPRIGLVPAAAQSLESAFAFVCAEHNYPATAYVRLAALLIPLLLAFFAPREGEVRGQVPTEVRGRVPAAAIVVVPLATFAVVLAGLFPSFYAMSREPPPRALLTTQFVLICGLVCWGWMLGAVLRRAYPKPSRAVAACCVALALVMAAFPPYAAKRTLAPVGRARSLAAIWDRRDAEIRAAVARGERRLTVPADYNLGGTDMMTGDAGWYVNECAAAFYGAETITATHDGEGSRVMFGEDSTTR